jgi:hypothetical protein
MTLSDTGHAERQVRDAVLRRLSEADRARLTIEMSDQAFEVARRGLRQRHPEYTEEDVRLAMLRLLHGDDLVQRIYPTEPLRAT